MEETKDESLADKNLKELIIEMYKDNKADKQQKEKKTKSFRLPWSSRVGNNAMKRGYVTVCYIDENKGVSFFKAPITEGVFKDKKDIPHVGTPDYILTYKNKPLVIQPSWSQYPFSPSQHFKETIDNKTSSHGWRLLANNLETTQIKPKGGFGGFGGWIMLLLIVGAVAYYFLNGGTG